MSEMNINALVDSKEFKKINSFEYGGHSWKMDVFPIIEEDTPRDNIVFNFKPKGEPFIYICELFNKDQDTLLIDVLIPKNIQMQNIFTLIVEKNSDILPTYMKDEKKHGQIHLQAPSAEDELVFSDYDYPNNSLKLVKVPIPSDRHCIIAANKNGCYCNGQLVSDNSRHYTFINKLNNDFNYIGIGSQFGDIRSYAKYKEISVLHKLLSVKELVVVTSIE